MLFVEDLISLALLIPVISVHEFAHAFAANKLGDPTPKMSGRLTLNPLAHLDPVGTLSLLFFKIGWGKPVPINIFNLKNIKRDQAVIAFAGPFSNFALAIFLAMLFHLIGPVSLIGPILYNLVWINLILGFFNLIPIGPLDGFKVVLGLLPDSLVPDWLQTEKYGVFLLIFLMVTGVTSKLFLIPASFFINILL